MAHFNSTQSRPLAQANEQLFTEVAPAQAAMVQGGLTLSIHRVQCLKAGADGFFGGSDDLKILADGVLMNSPAASMKTGRSRTFGIVFGNSRNSVAVDLFDDDFPSSGDDFMGGFTTGSTGGQIFSKQVSGSGSRYRVFYSAV